MFDLFIAVLKLAAEAAMHVVGEMRYQKPTSEDMKHRTQNIYAGIVELQLTDGSIIYQAVVRCGDVHLSKSYTTIKTAEMGKDILVDELRPYLNV